MSSYLEVERRYAIRQFRLRLRRYGLILLALFFSIGIRVFWTGDVGQGLDRWALQQFFTVRGVVSPPDDIIIVGVDELVLQAYGRPLPRGILADGLEKMVASAPRFIIIDAVFDPSIVPDELEANERIAAALSSVPSSVKSSKSYLGTSLEEYITFQANEMIQASADFELPMTVRETGGRIEYITVSPFADAPLSERIPLSPVLSRLFDLSVVPGPYDRINFYGPAGTIQHLSFLEVLRNDLSFTKNALKDKIVFFGFQTVDQRSERKNTDEFLISASSKPMYGIEIHASIAANLLNRSWLRQIDFTYKSALVLGISFLICLVIFFLSPKRAGLLIFSALTTLTILNYLLFSWFRVWVGGVATLWLVSVGGIILVAFWTEHSLRKTKKRIEKYWGREI